MAQAVYSLESLKMGAAGASGVMGATLVAMGKIAAGTVAFDWPEPNLTPITSEEEDSPFVNLEEKQPKKISWESNDMSAETLQKAFGGAISMDILTAGVNFSIPSQSLEIITRKLQGFKTKWSFPLVQVVASISGSLQKSDLLRLKFTATILQPTDLMGIALADFKYEKITA
jgi:hypothetical protein